MTFFCDIVYFHISDMTTNPMFPTTKSKPLRGLTVLIQGALLPRNRKSTKMTTVGYWQGCKETGRQEQHI